MFHAQPMRQIALRMFAGRQKKLLLSMSQLQTGTTTSQGGSTTRHTVLMMPALFDKWTRFLSRSETALIAVSRHIGKLALIRPWDLSRKGTPAEARRLNDLLEQEVYDIATAYTLPRLAQEILEVVNEADVKSWVSKAFISWQKRHTSVSYTHLTLPTICSV